MSVVRKQILGKSLSEFASSLTLMTPGLHKGQRGRIGVVGGSEEYSGAPYFSGIAAEQGSDLVHIFCHPSASIPIKCYSPDLIVHPLFKNDFWGSEDKASFLDKIKKLDVMVLGPGCGTTNTMQLVMETVIEETKQRGMALVCDADVFRVRSEIFSNLSGHNRCILTPNMHELSLIESYLSGSNTENKSEPNVNENEILLYEVGGHIEPATNETELINRVIKATRQLNGPILFLKGSIDIITDGRIVLLLRVDGSIRRCDLISEFSVVSQFTFPVSGGQGDVLSGTIASILGFLLTRSRIAASVDQQGLPDPWTSNIKIEVRSLDEHHRTTEELIPEKLMAAAIASATVRVCAQTTELQLDGLLSVSSDMTTHDMIKTVGREFKRLPATFSMRSV